MSNQYFNFYYDPVRQGYDANTWNTVLGAPVVNSNQLKFQNSGAIHFADILRGDSVFNINISAPAAGDDIKVGFIEANKGEFAYFKVADDVLTAETYDGVTTKSIVIDWDGDWSLTNTEFGIKWEAGMVIFSIGGAIKATVSTNSLLDVPKSIVPSDPMNLYVYSDSTNPLLLKYINIKGIQSLMW